MSIIKIQKRVNAEEILNLQENFPELQGRPPEAQSICSGTPHLGHFENVLTPKRILKGKE